jgi:hypothetical protein
MTTDLPTRNTYIPAEGIEVEAPEPALPTWEALSDKQRDAIDAKVAEALADVCADLIADNGYPIRTAHFSRIRDTVNKLREDGMYQLWVNQEIEQVRDDAHEEREPFCPYTGA